MRRRRHHKGCKEEENEERWRDRRRQRVKERMFHENSTRAHRPEFKKEITTVTCSPQDHLNQSNGNMHSAIKIISSFFKEMHSNLNQHSLGSTICQQQTSERARHLHFEVTVPREALRRVAAVTQRDRGGGVQAQRWPAECRRHNQPSAHRGTGHMERTLENARERSKMLENALECSRTL
eukprot:gene18195-biopygen15964